MALRDNFAAKQQFGRYRGSSAHARRRFHRRLSVVPAIAAGRRPVPCSCCPSPFVDRVERAFIPKQRPRTHVNSTRDCDCSRSLQILWQLDFRLQGPLGEGAGERKRHAHALANATRTNIQNEPQNDIQNASDVSELGNKHLLCPI
jgi:hypothetical protein